MEATYFSFECLLQPIYPVTPKGDTFKRGPEQEKALQQVQAAMQASLPIGSYHPADPMMFKVSVADVLWSLFQALTGKSQHGSLELWSKSLPSSMDSYYTFEKQPDTGP